MLHAGSLSMSVLIMIEQRTNMSFRKDGIRWKDAVSFMMFDIFFQPKTSPIKVACYLIEASDKRAKHNDENKSKTNSFIFRHPIYLIHLSKVVDDHLALNSK